MATTYGYGGEFSSDEDIDRIERQSERIVEEKFNDHFNTRPNAQQIQETIEAIRNLSSDQDISLNDEVLAGLLDHFKTQRGPIVDSTRNLYKKIVFRVIREQSKKSVDNETNGNTHDNNNDIIDNVGIVGKLKPQVIDSFSSDDEELSAPGVQGTLKKKISDLVLIDNEEARPKRDDIEDMEVDVDTPHIGEVRQTKQVGISTDDENDNESSEDSDSRNSDSESDVLEVTPIKPSKQQLISNDKARSVGPTPSTPKRSESSIKRLPLAQSTPKDTTAKKPYTRSQRLAAARAATSNEKATDSFLTSKIPATSSIDGRQTSRRVYTFIGLAILIALVSYLIYHFRASILNFSTKGRQMSVNFV